MNKIDWQIQKLRILIVLSLCACSQGFSKEADASEKLFVFIERACGPGEVRDGNRIQGALGADGKVSTGKVLKLISDSGIELGGNVSIDRVTGLVGEANRADDQRERRQCRKDLFQAVLPEIAKRLLGSTDEDAQPVSNANNSSVTVGDVSESSSVNVVGSNSTVGEIVTTVHGRTDMQLATEKLKSAHFECKTQNRNIKARALNQAFLHVELPLGVQVDPVAFVTIKGEEAYENLAVFHQSQLMVIKDAFTSRGGLLMQKKWPG